MDNPTAEQMVVKYLLLHGFDGLFDDDCGCLLSDIAPCDEACSWQCKAGYNQTGGYADTSFSIGPEKPTKGATK